MREYEQKMKEIKKIVRYCEEHEQEIADNDDAVIMAVVHNGLITCGGAGRGPKLAAVLEHLIDNLSAAAERAEAQDIQEGRNGYQ
mgnify:CR=1 FL=1